MTNSNTLVAMWCYVLSDIGGDKSCLTLNTFFAEKFFIVFVAQETLKLPFPARFHGQHGRRFSPRRLDSKSADKR